MAEFEFTVLPPPPISPGVWTDDADRAKFSAEQTGGLVCAIVIGSNLTSWTGLKTILTDSQFLTWAAANGIYLVQWDYSPEVVGIVALLGTRWPITEGANVAFADVKESVSDGFSFRIELKLTGEESPEELRLVTDFVAGCIQTTGVLGTGFSQTIDPDRVMIDSATGRMTITPDPLRPAEFFRIVLPRD